MPNAYDMFACKLNELEVEYTRAIQVLRSCPAGDHRQLRQHRQELLLSCRRAEQRLETAAAGKSPALAELSALQLRQFQEMRQAVTQHLPKYLDHADLSGDSGQEEAAALYAEFAMDSAVQTLRFALYAALTALELQSPDPESQETQPPKGENRYE